MNHTGVKVNTDDCMLWALSKNNEGYAQIAIDGVSRRVHRVLYELAHGALDDGLVVDHLCENTACINIDHLEAVTHRENILRKFLRQTHCQKGHEYSEDNLYYYQMPSKVNKGNPLGEGWLCKQCKREMSMKTYYRKLEKERKQ